MWTGKQPIAFHGPLVVNATSGLFFEQNDRRGVRQNAFSQRFQ